MKEKSLIVALILSALFVGSTHARNVSSTHNQKIVSLKPNITQTLIDLGVGDQVSGVTTFCPKPNNQAEIVADYTSVDLEKLARLKPDLVFTSTENAQSRQFEMIEKIVPRIVLLDFRNFEAMKKSVVRIGEELGVQKNANDVMAVMNEKMKDLRKEVGVKDFLPLRFAAIVQHRPLIVAAGQTYVSTLFEEAGFKNVFGEDSVNYPQIVEEDIIKKNPAIIFDFVHDQQKDVGAKDFLPLLNTQTHVITLPIENFLAAPSSVESLELVVGAKNLLPLHQQLPLRPNILFNLTLPRFVLAFLVGLALSVCGVSFQSLLKNPLADPYILGISGGAALGYVAGVVAHVPVFFTPVFGFIGGLLSLIIIYRLACQKGVLSVTNLLLIGIVFNAFSFALILVMNSVANFGQAHQILYLLLGAVEPLPWSRLIVAAVVVLVVSAVLCLRANRLNVLSLGDEEAFHLGLNVNREKKVIFVLSSLLVGITVSLCGLIGFVGLVVPHMARLIVGADNRRALPLSALLGGVLLCGCEYLAGHIFAFDTLMTRLPVGAVTALIGAPVFVWLVKKGSGVRGQ